MPKASPENKGKNRTIPDIPEEDREKKLIKFELNYNNTRVLIESDNEETLNDVLDVIKNTCGDKDKAPIRKLLQKE